MLLIFWQCITQFQLTRSRGAWLRKYGKTRIYIWFQLTRSRGAWHDKTTLKGVVGNFNSHAHVERDPKSVYPCQRRFHFNSHAHVERDSYFKGVDNTLRISTHTLTWSVTRFYHIISADVEFQLTRSRGAWLAGNNVIVKEYIFQLTRSRGAWLPQVLIIKRLVHFNSHAHVERDYVRGRYFCKNFYFNSHAHVERDFS